MDVSRETVCRLESFVDLTLKWTRKINLIAPGTASQIWDRHVEDSLQLYHFGKGEHWVDLGSGGGFPGMVVAILGIELSPTRKFTLVESDARKASFLREAARKSGANAKIVTGRIEQVPSLEASTLSARALAPLDILLGFSYLHRNSNGISLFPKGTKYKEELEKAECLWSFEHAIHPSRTSPDGVIIEVGNHERA